MGGRHFRKSIANLGIFAVLVLASFVLVRCGGTSTTSGMGSANVTMSDPPANTDYKNVWVTVDGVEASVSTSDTGWVPLVTSLSSTSGSINAVQLDLLHLDPSNLNSNCLLSMLGSTTSLPAGNYQQIRLKLVPNNATGVNLLNPSSQSSSKNNCASVSAWNCAMPTGGTLTALRLSSQAQTGLKIPPGQILGGPISVAAGQSVDINIDFNADRSIVNAGGKLRLDPVLVAYQASKNLTGISGQVVSANAVIASTDQTTNTNTLTVTPGSGLGGANIAAELNTGPDDGTVPVDLIGNYITTTDSYGNFDICPLPTGPVDLVATAGPTTGSTPATYGATILTGVPNGAQGVIVPILQQGNNATLTGNVSATTTATTANNDSPIADIYALQSTGNNLEFAVPSLTGSTLGSTLTTLPQLSLSCDSSGDCPTNPFSLFLPPANPMVGSYGSSITWTQATTAPSYKVEATCNNDAIAAFSDSATPTAGSSTAVTFSGTTPLLTGCQRP